MLHINNNFENVVYMAYGANYNGWKYYTYKLSEVF